LSHFFRHAAVTGYTQRNRKHHSLVFFHK